MLFIYPNEGVRNYNAVTLPRINRILKLTAFLLVFFMQANAKGHSQRISLTVKDTPLEQVFEKIKKQTGINFLYNNEQLKKARPVSFSVKNATLDAVLALCFERQPFTYSLVDQLVVVRERNANVRSPKVPEKKNDMENPVSIRGKVLNEEGAPMAGVTVTVKGTKIATSTDKNGEFVLENVEESSVLVFTGISTETKEITVGDKTEFLVTLKNKVKQLGDVFVTVNTGYQKIPKERATGSFEFLDNEELNRKVSSDILSRLEGVANSVLFDRRANTGDEVGVNPSQILIRGISTITETIKAPLIVVNNFPYEGDINNINPNDIESITILKDAAAASIWGARAGNGVIVITTKSGRYNQKARLTVNANVSVIEKPDLFYYPSMSPGELIDVETFLFNNGFYDDDINNTFSWPALTPAVEILNRQREGLISSTEATDQLNALKNSDVRNDFDKYFYRTSVNQQYAIGVTGGSETIKYALSGGYDETQRNLKGNEFRRVTFRSNTSFSLVRNFDFNVGLAYASTDTKDNSPGGVNDPFFKGTQSNRSLYNYAAFADAAGQPLPVSKDFRNEFIDTAGGGLLQDWRFYPLQELSLTDVRTRVQDLVLNLGFDLRITPWLNASLSYQYEHSNADFRDIKSRQSYYVRNLVNLFSQIDYDAGTIHHVVPPGDILDEEFTELRSHQARGQLNFDHTWNDRHALTVIAGNEWRELKNVSSGNREFGFNQNDLSSIPVDLANFYDWFGNLGNSTVDQGPFIGHRELVDRFISVYANAAYTFDKKYTITASGRRDASNLFGVNTNDKWKPFWSAGVSWDISNERWWRVKWLNHLKLRATYGYQGNVNNTISPLTILERVPADGNPLLNSPFAFISVPGNPDLSWETIKQLNLALEFGTKNNRIQGTVEWYRKSSSDLILDAPVDPTTGLESVQKNSADLRAHGIDATLTTLNIDGEFKWITEVGFSWIDNKITDYKLDDRGRPVGGFIAGGGTTLLPAKGRAPYAIYSFPFAGLDPQTGDPLGYLGKQVSNDYFSILFQSLDTANIIYNGSALPRFFGFFNNTFSYKGFTVYASILYRFNYFFKKNTINYFGLFYNYETHADYTKRWQAPGDEARTTVPSLIYPVADTYRDDFYAGAAPNILKGDNIRLNIIRVSYDFTRKEGQKFPMNQLQLFLLMNNVGFIWRANDEKLDPDIGNGNGVFPLPRSYTFGVKLVL